MRTALITKNGQGSVVQADCAASFPLGLVAPRRMEAMGVFCADGGSTSNQEIVSSVKTFEIFRAALSESWATSVSATASDRVRSALHGALLRTNRQVFEAGFACDPVREFHVSAMTGMIFRGVLVFNTMGNVSIILLRDGRFHALSEDQSIAGALARRGLLRGRAAVKHPFARLSSRRLGSQPDMHPSFRSMPLKPGDILIASTDGVGELRTCEGLRRRLGPMLGSPGFEPPSAVRGIELLQLLEHQLNFHLAGPAFLPEDDATVMLLQIGETDMQQIVSEDTGQERLVTRSSGEYAPPASPAASIPNWPAKD